MSKASYVIRRMTRKDLDLAVNWAKKEGWNPGIYDADAFWATDPKGFFIGLLNNKPISVVSAVRYPGKYAFMGFYIVKKQYRSKGYGMQIFEKAWDYVKNDNIGADGVLENLKKYARVGLKLAHYNARYQGFGLGRRDLKENVVKLSQVPFTKVANYDDETFGFKRRKFLKSWINQPKSVALGYVVGGKLLGYGLIRKCFDGYKIGPLFADNTKVARALFDSLMSQVGKKDKVFFDPPEINKEAVKFAKDYKMKKVFATGRIYTKGQPKFPLKKWYGVTTFELG